MGMTIAIIAHVGVGLAVAVWGIAGTWEGWR